MIRDGIAEALRRGDEEEAAALERALEHFAAAAPGRSLPTDLTLEQRVRALGFDATAASWVRRRVEAYLGAMAGRFGVVVGEHLPPIPAPALPNARLRERR